jgi:hypothetical protein
LGGIIENFFSHYQRIPCLINNYERKLSSYRGLGLLYCSSYLSKKINMYITFHNNPNIKDEEEIKKAHKKELQSKRKLDRRNNKEKQKNLG